MASLRFALHAGFKAADFLYSRGEYSWCSNSQVVGWMMWGLTSAFKRLVEGVGGCVIGELGLEGCRCRTPLDASCWGIFRLPFCSGFPFVSLITSGC